MSEEYLDGGFKPDHDSTLARLLDHGMTVARVLLFASAVKNPSGPSPDELLSAEASDMPTLPPVSAQSILVCADEQLWEGTRRLTASGLQVHRAAGWAEALALARELKPSAVLLDSGFLEGAGPELCRALRRAWGTDETPVLALCRGGREVRHALSAGASDVVEKPVEWDLVERRLRTLASVRHSRTELEHNRRQLAQAHVALADGLRQFEQNTLIDFLTRLPNRPQFERLLERAYVAGALPLALLAVDLDRFVEINQARGRKDGDEILRRAAERLTASLRSWPGRRGAGPDVMTAARLGGAEFAVMLQESNLERLAALAQHVRDGLGERIALNGSQLHLSASIGIAIAADLSVTPETLVRRAETAMYAATRAGGGRHHFFDEKLGATAEMRRHLDQRLRAAFEGGGLEIHYQPQIAAHSRQVVGVEALLRWNDGESGWIPPSEFVPVAEGMGLMSEIGVFVLHGACRQMRTWLDGGLPPIRVAVNVSGSQFESGDFAAEVARVLADTRLDPALLELELSERGALRRDPRTLAQLAKLRALGVRLVVDNFGTGETAVGHLRRHALDGLKIDGSFVRDTAGEDGPVLSAAMAAMGRTLKLHVVAEGVETEAELRRAREDGCDAVQGFLFSRPVPPDELRRRVVLTRDRPGACELAEAV